MKTPISTFDRLYRVVVVFGVAALLGSLPVCVHAVTIDMVTVGNPGNANDAGGYRRGAVADSYQIGRYEVTIHQYTEFLNAVAKSDPYSLYSASMASDLNIAGISRSGASGSYSYSAVGSGNRPITYVSWFSAARFANWMQNGQGSGSTETGAYTLVAGQTSGTAPAKNPGASFYIPTENEWYKAAYYSPVKGGAASPGYYEYATQTDTPPGNVMGSGENQANYRIVRGGLFTVTQSSDWSLAQNYLTDVGVFTNSASYYGTFDQGGNVLEWTDLPGTDGSECGIWGGCWLSNTFSLSSSAGDVTGPSYRGYEVGFRLAAPVAVPEPSTYAMALAGLACGGYSMFRRRRDR